MSLFSLCLSLLMIQGIPPSKFEEVTGLSLGEKTVQEYTVCAVCLDLFFNPRACSPCGHLFCEQCLRQLKRFHPTSTPCPLCRTVIQVTIPHESKSGEVNEPGELVGRVYEPGREEYSITDKQLCTEQFIINTVLVYYHI